MLVTIVIIAALSATCHSWDTGDLELFDLVEEVNENFYSFLGVSKDAESSEIKKAFRKLSLQYHPDKNSNPDAPEKFRKLVAVADVLRNEELRKKYNDVLEFGLPNWRHPVYYYRRVRKLGLWELAIFLISLLSFGQYLISWTSYLEKKFTIEGNVAFHLKRQQKRSKKNNAAQEQEDEIRQQLLSDLHKPSFTDLFIISGTKFLLIELVLLPRTLLRKYKEHQELQAAKKLEEELKSDSETESDTETEKRVRRKVNIIPDASELCTVEEPVVTSMAQLASVTDDVVRLKTGEWDENEKAALIRAVRKYPVGTVERWEKIAILLHRDIDDVLAQAKELRTSGSAVVASVQSTAPGLSDPAAWSQAQQKALEIALQKYPKGSSERWERIAEEVPNKTKEECINRVKMIADSIKKKKEAVVQGS